MPYYVLIFWLLLPLVGALAILWGGRPERIGAALYIVAAILTLALRTRGGSSWIRMETGVLAIDLVLLAAMLMLALRSDRWWPMIATAFLGLSMLAHLAKTMNPKFSRLAYALMEGASSYPVVLTLLAAIVLGRIRHGGNSSRRFGASSPGEGHRPRS